MIATMVTRKSSVASWRTTPDFKVVRRFLRSLSPCRCLVQSSWLKSVRLNRRLCSPYGIWSSSDGPKFNCPFRSYWSSRCCWDSRNSFGEAKASTPWGTLLDWRDRDNAAKTSKTLQLRRLSSRNTGPKFLMVARTEVRSTGVNKVDGANSPIMRFRCCQFAVSVPGTRDNSNATLY